MRIFMYLNGTKHFDIKFTKDTNVHVFVDADLGGNKNTKRSTSGHEILIGSAIEKYWRYWSYPYNTNILVFKITTLCGNFYSRKPILLFE